MYYVRPVVSGGAGGHVHLQFFADQLTLSQPGVADYAHHINTGIPGFSDLPTALRQDLHAIASYGNVKTHTCKYP